MAFRVLTALAILSASIAASLGSANAQSFPFFRQQPPVQAQPVDDDDDDLEPPSGTLSPPGIQSSPLPPVGSRSPYPDYPQQQPQYLPREGGPRFSQPGAQAPQQGIPGQQQPGNPTVLAPAPGFIFPDDDRRRADPGFRQDPRQDTARGQDVIRPPGAVGAPTGLGPAANAPAAGAPGQAPVLAGLPPEDQPEIGDPKELPPHLQRQMVDYSTREPAGTIIIDTANTYLYLVMGGGKAMRYGIGVGREGFTWAGAEKVSRMAEWPDWHPPAEMIERQPYLPRFMAGGAGNPLGARALYLGKTLYRIHGTNQPSTIGTFVSSGCVRLVNNDVEDLYSRVKVGARVVVLPGAPPATAQANQPANIAPQQATR